MEKEIITFINKHNLTPFNRTYEPIKNTFPIHKTREGKQVHNRVLGKLSEHFVFNDTKKILHFFYNTNDPEKITARQLFFKQIKELTFNNACLKELREPLTSWKPPYDVIVVTENSETFNELKKRKCPVQIILTETDVSLLESKDIVQVLHCEEFGIALESLPQSVFLREINDAYLERYLETFSGWENNIDILNKNTLTNRLKEIIEKLQPLKELIQKEDQEIIDPDTIEEEVMKANEEIFDKIRTMTLQGESLINILNKGETPEELKVVIKEVISKYNLPQEILIQTIPLSIDLESLQKKVQEQTTEEYSSIAEKIKQKADEIKKVPILLEDLKANLLFFDFISGVGKYIKETMFFPIVSEEIEIKNAKNLFLEEPQEITFHLKDNIKCSILTGANSGGKTTLLEHIIQIHSLVQLGLPIEGEIRFPLFEEIYYFAKTKGESNKGAFEHLLSQMAKIKPGDKTLILADEIEAVREPGMAGEIISGTVEYYVRKDCFLVIATHLGQEVKKNIPLKSRIDGIEAKGLTEQFELIIDHNPVLGRLAKSTPELIIKKMANTSNQEYLKFIQEYIERNKTL